MSKLDEIEAYFASSVNRAREPKLQGEYEDWLIARVRKLESALERIRDDDYVDTKVAAFAAHSLKEEP